jgi:hypothetical protein
VKRALVLLPFVVALAACGGSSNTPVAHVGGEAITTSQLDVAVDHFKQEADAEGRSFPEKGTDAYKTVQRQALGLLVYRSELLQSAKRLAAPVSSSEVEQRMKSSSESEGDTAFARDTVRAQIAYEHIYNRVTAGSTVAGREAAMRKWVEQMKQAYKPKVSYEAGYAPAS